jgi:hypothetical protein
LRKNSNAFQQENNKIFLSSGSSFNQDTNSIDNRKGGKSVTEKITDRSKIDEQMNLNNLLGRRRSQLISSRDFTTTNQSQEKAPSDEINLNNMDLKSDSRLTSQKVKLNA